MNAVPASVAAKLARADAHLAELGALVDAFLAEETSRCVGEQTIDPDTGYAQRIVDLDAGPPRHQPALLVATARRAASEATTRRRVLVAYAPSAARRASPRA